MNFKKLFRILVEITIDALRVFVYFIECNLVTFANMFSLILPYAMYFLGQHVCYERQVHMSVGSEIFLPLIIIVINYYLRSTANKIGKGITVPIPDKRFTSVSKDGEVTIENRRVQELLLYMADLEDWMERKGLL